MTRLALLLLLLVPLAAPAQEAAPTGGSPADPATSGEEVIDQWQQTLREAQTRVDQAREQLAAARYSYRDARQRERRGDAKAAVVEELEAAEQELAEAEAALPALLEEARRAGVPPGVLREFED